MTFITALLSGALLLATPTGHTPVYINKVDSRPHGHTVQAKLPEKKPQVQTEEKAPTEPQTISPETVSEPAPQLEPVAQPEQQILIGCTNYHSIFSQYDWNVHVMEAICQAESGGKPNAISPPNWDGLSDYGLMQIHGEYILDPSANIARAYGKYQSQGLSAWSTYTNGAYLKYL